MNNLYNGVVSYERIKYAFTSFLTGLLGVCFLGCAISAIATSMSSVNSTSTNNNKDNTPSQSPQNSFIGGSILSCFGFILLLVSAISLYMSTSTSKANEHMLAVQGVGNAVGTFTSIFHKNGGYFMSGE